MFPSDQQSNQELPPHLYLEALTRRISGFSFRERINVLRDQRIPRFLDKFRAAPDTSDSLHSITDIILNSNLWLSSPADFNDPFDMARKMVLDATGVQNHARPPYHFRPEALSALILGCRAEEKSILKLVSDRRSNGLPRPRLYRAIQHDRKYKITLRFL
jgi:hypothetical protein